MFIPQNKIIMVDNRKDQLDYLSAPFQKNGIGCRTYEYDSTFTTPLKGVRIAFFDINLNELSSPEDKKPQVYAALADALRLYIDNENGPFALIFWTSNIGLIEDFKGYINTRQEQVPFPIVVSAIDKHEFLEANNDIESKLREILSDPTIELLFDFESTVTTSASHTVDQVFEIIPNSSSWGDNQAFKNNFDRIFSKIAESCLGYVHAKANPTKAVYSALLPMLNYYVNENTTRDSWGPILTSLSTSSTASDLQYPEHFNWRKLNSVFHLELRGNLNVETRGAVVKYLVECPSDIRQCKCQYFKDLENRCKELFELFVQFDDTKIEKKARDVIRAKSEFVLLEISAACDYSQGKKRLNKYVLGLLSPAILPVADKMKSEAVFKLPDFYYDGNECQLRLNFNFVHGLLPSDSTLHAPLFILKGGIMDMIGTRYANHVSRIGITSF